jgi:hypothetical protein
VCSSDLPKTPKPLIYEDKIIFNKPIIDKLVSKLLKMASNALYKQLEAYNKNFKNDFKENWGSLLTYLQVNDTEMMMRASNNYSINLENNSGLTKQTLYRKKENNSSNRHTKLESLSRNRSIKTGPGISRLNITNKLQNTLN